MMDNQRLNGQFFTITNPFKIDIFYKWFDLIPKEKRKTIIEPFAGSNNIVSMIKELGIEADWFCYDIELSDINKVEDCVVVKRDTIKDFPKNKATVAITNPPYLAKNSATRLGFNFAYPEYDNLYKKSLEVMLNNCEYVAAIIPESFITANLFHNRLFAVSSLTCKMFEDTECPVCLALFIPETDKEKLEIIDDFYIYRQNKYINLYSIVKKFLILPKYNLVKWKMNDKDGNIGIRCIDNTKKNTILFVRGYEIEKKCIKVSSRTSTRVSGLPSNIDLDTFIEECNKILKEYRENTSDIFLTCFKGLREDGFYRRRLDFKTAKDIMSLAVEKIINKE